MVNMRPRAQAYSSETGRLLDNFTLRKPVRSRECFCGALVEADTDELCLISLLFNNI